LGLCPCPGVMTVLLFLESFGLSENLFLFTLSMSTGIFLVILFFGILANTFKKTLVEDENFKLHKILTLVGAGLMILFGIFQILILGE
jgi:transporter, ni2+-co2+ transporter family